MLNQDEVSPGGLAAHELRGRAAGGAAMLGARGALIFAVGVVANVLLARLLSPRDFGLFALGLVVVVAGTHLADGGFGGALIKRTEPPTLSELQAVAAFQLGITILVALAVALAAIPLGREVELIALMVSSLPIATVRAPSVVLLERHLEYRPIATADLVEALVFYASAITGVALGLGVWGLGIAVVLRSVAGSATMVAAGPLGLVVPRWSWRRLRPLLAFGVKSQATGLVGVARGQVLNVAIGAVAGLATLGVWTLAWRVMQVPALLFQTVGRVAFPAMSRLLGANQDPRPVLERQVAAVAAVNAIVVVALVGFAPALPAIVGNAWGDVAEVLLWSGIALIVGAPIGIAAGAFLTATGRPGRVALATAVSGIVWVAVTVVLLGPVGAPAVGIGWLVSSVVNAVMVWRPVAKLTGAAIVPQMALPMAIALAATAVGWLAAHRPSEPVVGGVIGLIAGELVLVVGLLTVSRPALRELSALGRLGLRSFRRPVG